MAEDARFADADPRPLALRAEDEADLRILSSLVQDAVLTGADISHDAKARRLSLLITRFRWEDAADARLQNREFERVRSVLVISDVMRVVSDGVGHAGRPERTGQVACRWISRGTGPSWPMSNASIWTCAT